MTVLGYETGSIACRAAFTADFEVSKEIPLSGVISQMDLHRRMMDLRRGMRIKYVPLRFDPATGAHQIGGRYLFETWEDAVDYVRFTTEELEFEPGIKFWERPFFSNIQKHAWHVIGAHEFTPLTTHYASRFERFECDTPIPEQGLEATWNSLCETALKERLAAVWLLFRPEERQIGLLSMATRRPGDDDAKRASRTLAVLEGSPSLSESFASRFAVRKVFDRTSLNLSLWLPRSRELGGDARIFPTFPVHPLPETAETH